MAEESLNIPSDTQNIEYHIVTLFEKLDALRRDSACVPLSSVQNQKPPMQVEIRTLEFWRSIISECLASFFYVFIVCGAIVGASINIPSSSPVLAAALAAGFAMATLTQCFGHISGAHVNPAVTAAMAITRNISPLRAAMFITAQCGGGIAGAALLYGVSEPGYQNKIASVITSNNIHSWERFGIEFFLTFMVVFTYFVSMDTYRKWMGSSALAIGAAYSACTFVSMPYLNPARSLGPSFVMNKWENHWVYWFGPLVGGMISGLIYEFIFNPRRHIRRQKDSIDGDSSSMHSDEDTYDDLDKPAGAKFHGSTYNTYRPSGAPGPPNSATGYCASVASASLYSAPPTKLERVESLYGGTKSLYCKSPPLTRANLNRSQSVYAKSNTAINRDIIPRPGPLVPAQSLYPMRLNQQNQSSHVQNQNVQNQMQQRSESVYGVRAVAPGMATRTEGAGGYGNSSGTNPALYGTRNNPSGSADQPKYEDNPKFTRGNRPESMYGMVSGQQRRGQSAQSDDSSYGSYHGSNTTPRNANNTNGNNFTSTAGFNSKGTTGGQSEYNRRQVGGSEVRQSPPTQLLSTVTNSTSFHHSRPPPSQHSPNSQY